MNKTLQELIIKRNREIDLAHQALTPESRKKHWKEINRLNEEIRRNNMNAVKLQGVYNAQPAKAVKDLKVGDIITWNYGYKSEVMELIPSKTGKTVTVMLKSHETGKINPRKMRADRLVVA